MDDSYKLFYKQFLDFGPGVGYKEGKEKYMREKRQEEERKRIYNEDVAMMSEPQKYLQALQLFKGFQA